jgi:hypothetical protein
MPDISTTTWFPVLTLLGGFGTKSLADWFDYRRGTKREREAREWTRRGQVIERRINFQHQTLLDLQETCMQLARATGAMHHLDVVAFRTHGTWQKELLPEDLNENSRLAQTKTMMLAARVRDDVTRSMVENFKNLCVATSQCATERDGKLTLLVSAQPPI